MGSLGELYPLLLTPLLILNYEEILPGRLSLLAAVIPMAIASASFAGLWPDLQAMLREKLQGCRWWSLLWPDYSGGTKPWRHRPAGLETGLDHPDRLKCLIRQ